MNNSAEKGRPSFLSDLKGNASAILTVVAFVSGVAFFIQSAREDWGLYFAIMLGSGFFLVWYGFIYVRKRKHSVDTPWGTSRELYYSPLKRTLALVGIITWPLLVLGVLGWRYVEEQSLRAERIVVLVAKFDGPDETYRVTSNIVEHLREATKIYEDTRVVELREKITAGDGSVVAEERGKEHDASIVMWGWYYVPRDTADVIVHFKVLEKMRTLPLEADVLRQYVAVTGFQIQTKLSNQMGFLTLLTLGLIRYEAGDYEGALDRFTAALSHPDVPTGMIHPAAAYFARGTAYAWLGDHARATADFDRVIERDSTFAKAYFNRGATRTAQNLDQQAKADYDLAIEFDSTFAAAYMNRGAQFLDQGEFAKAIADFDQAIRFDSDMTGAYFNRGVAYRKKGNYAKAISDLGYFIELDGGQPRFRSLAHYNRGIAFLDQGEFAKAIADFDRAIDIDTTNVSTYYYRGIAYGKENNLDQAIADYDYTTKRDSTFVEAYYNRSLAYMTKGDNARAVADFERVLKLDSSFAERTPSIIAALGPSIAAGYNNVGTNLAGNGFYTKAVAAYDRSIELDSTSAKTYFNRAQAYEKMSQYARAVTDYDLAIEYDSTLVEAYLGRAIIHGKMKRSEKALADFDRIIRLGHISSKLLAKAYNSRGVVHAEKGDLEDAIADFDRAIEHDPNLASVKNNRDRAVKLLENR